MDLIQEIDYTSLYVAFARIFKLLRSSSIPWNSAQPV